MAQMDWFNLIEQIKANTGDPQASDALTRLTQYLKTPEGQQTAQKFIQAGDPAVMSRAAQCVQSGDMDGAKQALSQLLSTPQGAGIATMIYQKLKN